MFKFADEVEKRQTKQIITSIGETTSHGITSKIGIFEVTKFKFLEVKIAPFLIQKGCY